MMLLSWGFSWGVKEADHSGITIPPEQRSLLAFFDQRHSPLSKRLVPNGKTVLSQKIESAPLTEILEGVVGVQ
jgi:hypothetical protein